MQRRRRRLCVVISCEHGGNRVPARYSEYFRGARGVLASHRGHDIGALSLARDLSRSLRAPLFAGSVTRLLVDLNRSVGHPKLLSRFVRALSAAAKADVLARYYQPHRASVEAAVRERILAGACVLHVAVHSFTPVLSGVVRQTDIGILYDPHRSSERRIAHDWQGLLAKALPEMRVRRNYPYRGASDGLTTALRRLLPPERYLGVEIEVNQKHLARPNPLRRRLALVLGESLAALAK